MGKATVKRVSPNEFVKLWQKANSPAELAEKLGVSAIRVSSRASAYRKEGVPLKKFASVGSPRIDFDSLKKIAIENGPKGEHNPRKKPKSKS